MFNLIDGEIDYILLYYYIIWLMMEDLVFQFWFTSIRTLRFPSIHINPSLKLVSGGQRHLKLVGSFPSVTKPGLLGGCRSAVSGVFHLDEHKAINRAFRLSGGLQFWWVICRKTIEPHGKWLNMMEILWTHWAMIFFVCNCVNFSKFDGWSSFSSWNCHFGCN